MNPFFCKNVLFITRKTSRHTGCKQHLYSLTFLLSFSTKVSVYDYLVNQHGFPPSTAKKASLQKSFFNDSRNSDLILSFLRDSGFSRAHVEKVVEKAPAVLTLNFENYVKPKIKMFQDLSFTQTDIADIIATNPQILTRSLENYLLPSLVMLKDMLGGNENVCKLLKMSCRFLNHSFEKTLVPNIELMTSCGMSKTRITRFMFLYPRFLLMKPDRMKELVKRVDELGFDRNSKMFIYAIRCLSSMTEEKWESKLQLFQSLGLSMDETLALFRKSTAAFPVSERKIKEIADYLVSNGKCDLAYLLAHAFLFSVSLEVRIKPRLLVWETLKKKGLISESYNLSQICKVTDKDFFEKYVYPYENEVGSLFKSKKVLMK